MLEIYWRFGSRLGNAWWATALAPDWCLFYNTSRTGYCYLGFGTFTWSCARCPLHCVSRGNRWTIKSRDFISHLICPVYTKSLKAKDEISTKPLEQAYSVVFTQATIQTTVSHKENTVILITTSVEKSLLVHLTSDTTLIRVLLLPQPRHNIQQPSMVLMKSRVCLAPYT